MTFLYTAITLFLLFAYMRAEASWVEVRRVKHTDGEPMLKIVHLSDIHIRRMKVPVSKVKRLIASENPDFVIMTGDYIEAEREIPQFLNFLERTVSGLPVYLCLGNHDYKAFNGNRRGLEEFLRQVEKTGAKVLHNQTAHFDKSTKRYSITGLEDLRCGEPDVRKATKDLSPDTHFRISFSHNPDLALHLPEDCTDCFLCGHFHGGQIWTPFNLEFKLLRRDVLCRRGIDKGFHRVNGINTYISRGLGNVCLPLRFLSRPEITVHYLP